MWFPRRPRTALAKAARRSWPHSPSPRASSPLRLLRWICVDTETSGLDPYRDRLLALGACAVEGNALCLSSTLEIVVRQEVPSSIDNVLVHGIGHGAQANGEAQDKALATFLRFSARSVLIGFHTLFDVLVLQRAARLALGLTYRPIHLDVALLLPALLAHRAPAAMNPDDWLDQFDIRPFARHAALADAMATAEVFLLCLDLARRRGLETLGELLAMQKARLRLEQPGGS